jgi:threonine/homoserine/homoserine lactone efflux protein
MGRRPGVVGTIVLLAASGGDASEKGEPATWVDVVKLVLGALLVLLAVKQWRGRPREGEEAALPTWMQAIDTFAPCSTSSSGGWRATTRRSWPCSASSSAQS